MKKDTTNNTGSNDRDNDDDNYKDVETCPSYSSTKHLPRSTIVNQYRKLSSPHVDSFNYFIEYGLQAAIQDIEPIEICIMDTKRLQQQQQQQPQPDHSIIKDATTIQVWIENVRINKPCKKSTITTSTSSTRNMNHMNNQLLLYPRECRERGIMYAGTMYGTICFNIIQRRNYQIIKTSKVTRIPNKSFGDIPIMVNSTLCHLHNLSSKQLVRFKEEDTEFGGYFIVNGIERCIRLLQIPKRNYATAIQRSNYKKRGSTYSDLGIAIKCIRYNGDQSSITNTIHYLTTGTCTLRFVAKKQEFLIPIILLLRSLSGGNSPNTNTNTTSNEATGIPSSGLEGTTNTGMGGTGIITDEELFRRVIQNDETNNFLVVRANLLLQDSRARFGQYNTPNECLAYIGSRMRRIASCKCETTSDIDIGHYIIRKYILIHLYNYNDKLEYMIYMIRKLYNFAAGECGIDNADSLQNQEILLPGHLFCSFVKEKFEELLDRIKTNLQIQMQRDYKTFITKYPKDMNFWNVQIIDRASQKSSGSIGKLVSYFLSTGNIISSTGLDLMQVSGYTIVAERLNFLRYCSHFRSVHRGQFFMEMKTTTVRKLLPDSYGFLCPVHTPDGGPCGLLSHLTLVCQILAYPDTTTNNNTTNTATNTTTDASNKNKNNNQKYTDLDTILYTLGVIPTGTGGYIGDGRTISTYHHLPVCCDGRIIGSASPIVCKTIVAQLRQLKVGIGTTGSSTQQQNKVPSTLEVAYIPPGNPGAPYPGLFLATGPARMIRPVLHRGTGCIEWIGPLEQGFMDIACLDDDIYEGITTHQELDPTNMLSLVANMTPYSDQNQSPRNMYQCQMGKQTMGTPCHSLPYRTDNKLYRLLTPQAPICQTIVQGKYNMDEYPNGTNAVVAVLSYTGFDMEDAMILNKSSYERGFAHATVYKTIVADLAEEAKFSVGNVLASDEARIRFGNKPRNDGKLFYDNIENDGFPEVGSRINYGDAIYATVDSVSGHAHATKHKDRETAYVENVRMIGNDTDDQRMTKAKITLRYPRNPTTGDKFASRHGQKGVLSNLWPQEDMPFSESGISPDIIINPHAFPSRMTIGMLVESMAGKSGALHGRYQDATPFSFHESGDKVSLDYFGEELMAAGYNYYGSEALYSGTSGCVLQADLYIGIVYYQRLRHMVSDKYQVRSTGPINALTRQPIKGRKKGGGIRLGEMERDSLLSHGAAFLLQDRLLNCSDRHVAYICSRCGDLLMPTTNRVTIETTGQSAAKALKKPKIVLFCRSPECLSASEHGKRSDDAVQPVVLPYVYRYLVNELAAMNLKIKMEVG